MALIQDFLIGANDKYAPLFPKPSLQKYDNYQIYDIYSTDVVATITAKQWYKTELTKTSGGRIVRNTEVYLLTENTDTKIVKSLPILAAQKYSPYPILINLQTIIESCNQANLVNYNDFQYYTLGVPNPNLSENIQLSGSNTETSTTITFGLYNLTNAPIPPIYPNYVDLVTGYVGDLRIKINKISFVPTKTETVTFAYYRHNSLESLPITTVDYYFKTVQLIKNVLFSLDLSGIMLGTLYCSNSLIKSQIEGMSLTPNYYPISAYFIGSASDLVNYWISLLPTYTPPPNIIPNNTIVTNYDQSPVNVQTVGNSSLFFTYFNEYTNLTNYLRKNAANNDIWKKDSSIPVDINFDSLSTIFTTNAQLAFEQHINLQLDGSRGSLIMDSPRIIDIWTALEAGKYSVYTEQESGDIYPRVSNLGWYLENIARILGLRVDGKGYIDSNQEEDLYTRSILDNPQYDKNAYSKNSFGRYGRLTPHLTNSNGGKAFDKVADIPQLIEACFEHVNRSVGIQQGTEIEILNSTTGKKDYYPNQFAMLLDIHSKVTEIQLNAKENHNLIIVIAHEIRELFSGVGVPVSFKTLYSRYGKFMYLGHQSDKGSLLTSLTTLKMNVGMLVGNLLVDRPRDSRNPLERIFDKPKKKG